MFPPLSITVNISHKNSQVDKIEAVGYLSGGFLQFGAHRSAIFKDSYDIHDLTQNKN